ncbi:hypothetical protein G3M48_009152 [Beauveria asiatica]|uniref:Cytochrome P450 n=1 Tax=Beauveria asiatica TaxID=1069075 RepID=A0AAW0RJ50_9HYPO
MTQYLVLLMPLVVLVLAFVVYRRWLHPLSHFPGPFIASVSGLYQTYWNFQPNFQENFTHLHEKYGPIVRYSPNGIIFSDYELLSVAYGRRADKSDFFAANFDTDATFNRKWLAGDNVSLLISGKPLGFIETESDVHDLLRNQKHAFRWINFLSIQDNFSWYIRNTWLGRKLVMAHATDRLGVGVYMKERDCIVASAFDEAGVLDKSALIEGTLLSSLLTDHYAGNGMTLTDVRAEVLFALLAGSSVTPTNLWTTVFLISRDAAVKTKLGQELQLAESLGQIPPPAHIISDAATKALPYLHACIQEALRFSPTMSQLPRLSPRDTGLELHGKFVPPGFSVSSSPWIIGRSKALYGEDADVYRPERWLEASPAQLRCWDKNSFYFGYGGRKCAARRFALTQMYKAVAEMFRRFDVQPAGPTHGTSAGKPSTTEFRFMPKPGSGQTSGQ